MRSLIFRILLILGSIGVTGDIAAQTPDSSPELERLRIGLVLGGGGARGAAHIGVLRELERLRVPIDAIAGTSMGAIVGGLYASGKTPAELQELVESLDWADALTDDSKRENKSFRRKQDDAAFPVKFELGVKEGKLYLPKGLIQGQKLHLILREETLHVSRIENFDDLPTPFRAVASDITTGERYVMSKGDLALAIRASMSAPGVFSPVVVDGRTLVDGGLVGNVPVEVIQAMGVDIVIAVDVEFPLYPPENLQSALAITEQMLTILIRKETRRQLSGLGENDLLIRPELGEYGSTNFIQIGETIEPGAAAAAAMSDRLSELSLTEDQYREFVANRVIDRSSAETIDFINVVNDGTLSAGVLEARLKTKPGDVVDADQLARDAERLYGLTTYEQVSYDLVHEDDKTGVEFAARPKSWGPNFLQFGLALENDFEGSTIFNVASRLTMTGVNALGAEWRNDLQLGTEPSLNSEFYQPLSFDSRYFVAPHVDLEQENFNAFADANNIARYRVSEAAIGLDVGRELGRWGELRLGVFRGAGDARVKVGDPSLPNFDFDTGGAFARFRVDTLDDAQIPKSGSRVDVEWVMSRPGFGADSKFDTVKASIDNIWTWNKNTVQFGVEYATTVESDNQIQEFFRLGGFLRLSGLERGAISGPHSGLARLVYYHSAGETGGGLFDIPLYFGGSLEAGNVWQSRSEMSFDSMIVNGSLFAGIDTYIGPIFLAAGLSEHGDSSFYLFLGNTGPFASQRN